MRLKKLGNTGLLVSELCLGTMTFGNSGGMFAAVAQLQQSEVDAIVRKAIESGINFLDSADVYHNGQSEVMTGLALRNMGLKRDEFVLATKVRGRMGPGANQTGLSRTRILNAIDESLQRLQLDYVDLYQIHGYDPLTPMEETLEALHDVVRAGKARYIGLCNLPAWEIAKSLWISDKKQLARFASVQAYYSIGGRELEREIVPLAGDQKLAILPWSPLAGGFLSGKFTRDGQGPKGARRSGFDFPPIDRERAFNIIDAMRPIAAAHDASVARVALAWLAHQPHVTSIIIGAKNTDQLADNVAATRLQLSATELATLNTVSAIPSEYPGWMLERQGADRRDSLR